MVKQLCDTHRWSIVEKVLAPPSDRWWGWDAETWWKLKRGRAVLRNQLSLIPKYCFHFGTPPLAQPLCLLLPFSPPLSFPALGKGQRQRRRRWGEGSITWEAEKVTCSSRTGAGNMHTMPAFPVIFFRRRTWPLSLILGTHKIWFEIYSSVH